MLHKVRIALVRPSVDVLHKFSKPVECLALGYLAASVRLDGHEVFMLDGMLYDWSAEETVDRILDTRPDIVGFTVILAHFPDHLLEVLRRLRVFGYRGVILVGGHSVSFFADRVLRQVPEVDAVICGEGEIGIRQVAAAMAAQQDWTAAAGVCVRDGTGVRRTPPVRNYALDEVPWPARDLTAEVIRLDGLACVSTSRGCYARCSFCSIPRFYGLDQNRPGAAGGWIGRRVDDVVAEIDALHKAFSLRELLIVDDEFFGGTEAGFERARLFARRMEELHLPLKFALSCRAENVREPILLELMRGGLAHVFIGIESGSQKSLRLYGKGHDVEQNRRAVEGVKRLGLSFQPGFMLFNTRKTIFDVREDLQFLKEINECKPVTINSGVDAHFGAPLTGALERDGVLRDEGLRLTVEYPDAKVRAAKKIAELCAEKFQGYMNLIATLRSSITWEWRRKVPGRRDEQERLLDAFEKAVNQGFADIVVQAVDELIESDEAETVISVAQQRIASLMDMLEVSAALVKSHIATIEGGIRYWTQQSLIERGRTLSTDRSGSDRLFS
ncbi:MAG: radical SAM protein [Silvibacterium sp.]|jgi:radical SAM superfamily enzyme YgiQ (UPF0313 family)